MGYKKALIITFSGIGDAVLTEVLCENLRKMDKDIEIDFVVKNNAAPLFTRNKAVTNVISYENDERKNIFKYIAKIWNITRKKYDIILDIESTPRTELFSLLSLSSKFRIGKNKISKHKILGFKITRGWFYTHKITEDRKNNTVIESIVKFLDPIVENQKVKMQYTLDYKVDITEEEKLESKKIMESVGIDFSKKIITCGVNAVFEWKRWKREHMVNVLKYVIDNYDYQLVLFYTPKEKDYTLEIAKELEQYSTNKKGKVFYNITTKNVRDLAKIIANADIYFGNEGGTRHITQALGKSTVAVCRKNDEKTRWIVEDENHLALVISDFIPIEGIQKNNLTWENMTSEMVISKLKVRLDNLK
jgi:ADP-heptose:LPS heptosyltransferase